MLRLIACGAALMLTACGGPEPAESERRIVQNGVPVTVMWNRADRARARAKVAATDVGADTDLLQAIVAGTGCAIAADPAIRIIGYRDGARALEAATDCSVTGKTSPAQEGADPLLARSIDRAVAQVSPRSAPGAKALFEGSPYAAFTAAELARYCAEDWEERIAPSGRTEYNPCRRRDAFR